MQNAISCGPTVQNTVSCTMLATNSDFLGMVRKDYERENHQSSASLEAELASFKPITGEYPRDYGLATIALAAPIHRGTVRTSVAFTRIDSSDAARVAW